MFDILTKLEMSLTNKVREAVKNIARDLLQTLKKEKLVLDWRKRRQARASVRVAVEEVLDRLPDTFTDEVYWNKVDQIYQHIYDNYRAR